jgi:hypothetical protein
MNPHSYAGADGYWLKHRILLQGLRNDDRQMTILLSGAGDQV